MRAFARLVLPAVLLASLVVAAPVQAPSADAATNSERYEVDLINYSRRYVGERPLRFSEYLSTIARRHSREMAARWRLYHNPDLGSDVKGWRLIGENVGYGRSVYAVHRAFMNSPGHRRNVLDSRYRYVGAGVVYEGGRAWVTTIFYK